MEIFANEQKLPFEPKGEKSLGELVNSLIVLANQVNKVVTQVIVDAQPINLEDKSSYKDRSLEGIQKVEVSIEEKIVLVLLALSEAKSKLPKFITTLTEVSELLMAGQKHKAMGVFAEALGLWSKIINYLKTVGVSYNIDFNQVKFDNSTVEQKNLELLEVLQSIKKAMEDEDIVTLSDLIEYELIEKVNQQNQIIDTLREVTKKVDKEHAEQIKSKLETAAISV